MTVSTHLPSRSAMISRLLVQVSNAAATIEFFQRLGCVTEIGPSIESPLAQAFGQSAISRSRCWRIILSDTPFQVIDIVELPGVRQRPFAVPGFAALELISQNLEEVTRRLNETDITLVGSPKTLSFSDNIRAMQVQDSSGFLIYFTEVNGPVPGFVLPIARDDIGECFVVILAVADIEASCEFYANLFECAIPTRMESPIAAQSLLRGVDRDTTYSIAALPLGSTHWLEIDQWVAPADQSNTNRSGLAGSQILCVSITRSDGAQRSVARDAVSWVSADGALHELIRGPDGEAFELILIK